MARASGGSSDKKATLSRPGVETSLASLPDGAPCGGRAVPISLVQGDPVQLARSVLAERGTHDASTVIQRVNRKRISPK